jgi:hypothetical protein
MSRYPTFALAAILGTAMFALAQAPRPESGFFAPKTGDDPSLTHTLPPESYPGTPATVVPAPAPVPVPVPVPAAPPAGMTTTTVTTTVPQPAAVESAMDRAEAEARRAQAEARRAQD